MGDPPVMDKIQSLKGIAEDEHIVIGTPDPLMSSRCYFIYNVDAQIFISLRVRG